MRYFQKSENYKALRQKTRKQLKQLRREHKNDVVSKSLKE